MNKRRARTAGVAWRKHRALRIDMKVLLAEDDESVAEVLQEFLVHQRHLVDVTGDGEAAWNLIELGNYDLILLDVLLPKLDGISLCRRLRSKGHRMPVLLLTGLDASTDKVAGLDAGADDYVVKPCDLAELAARIRALLRRGGAALPPVLEWGPLRLDPNTCEVSYQGQPLHLTPKEYNLLELFLRGGRRVYSRSAIVDHLWPFEEPPEEDTVKAHVKGLRHKLRAVGAPADLIETVYGLGYRLKPQASLETETATAQISPAAVRGQLHSALAGIWERSKANVLARVAVLERASLAMLEARLDDALRQQAEREAHKLAGSLGTFGFREGSRLARSMEQALQAGLSPTRERALRFAEGIVALQRELEGAAPAPERPLENHPRVLAVDPDQPLAQALQDAAGEVFLLDIVCGVEAAHDWMEHHRPDLIVLDLHPVLAERLPAADEAARWSLLGELATRQPPIPALVLSDRHSFEERIEATRLGSRAFLEKPVGPERVIGTVERVLERARRRTAKVMIVDDDAPLLAALRALLAPWGLQLLTLADPLQFWQQLESFRPDLLVLDVEMPHLSGIELCRIVRGDPQWQWLPVLFLSCHTDEETIQRAWAGGADDFVAKPVSGPNLAMRILNRLERRRSPR